MGIMVYSLLWVNAGFMYHQPFFRAFGAASVFGAPLLECHDMRKGIQLRKLADAAKKAADRSDLSKQMQLAANILSKAINAYERASGAKN